MRWSAVTADSRIVAELKRHYLPGTALLVKTSRMNTLHGKSILVIDDDPGMLHALEKVLSVAGADVTSAEWAGDGMPILTNRQKTIHLVITDLRMPFVNGATVVSLVHQVFPDMPVIVLTAFASPEARAACIEQGVVAFLEKPLNSDELTRAVCQALALSPSRGESDESPAESSKRH
jgi:DNA-binding NtrC family response regulator